MLTLGGTRVGLRQVRAVGRRTASHAAAVAQSPRGGVREGSHSRLVPRRGSLGPGSRVGARPAFQRAPRQPVITAAPCRVRRVRLFPGLGTPTPRVLRGKGAPQPLGRLLIYDRRGPPPVFVSGPRLSRDAARPSRPRTGVAGSACAMAFGPPSKHSLAWYRPCTWYRLCTWYRRCTHVITTA